MHVVYSNGWKCLEPEEKLKKQQTKEGEKTLGKKNKTHIQKSMVFKFITEHTWPAMYSFSIHTTGSANLNWFSATFIGL